MRPCLILIVEDDKEAVESWRRDISDFNSDNEAFKYEAIYAGTREAAIETLDRVRVNCAVVDLRLPSATVGKGEPSQDAGNDILSKLLIETGIPAVVYSAHSGEASDLVKKSNIQVRSKKGGGVTEILLYLAKLEGLMTAMAATRKKISIESAKIFNDSIWHRWESAWRSVPDRDVVAGMITRQTASHVADRLSLPPLNHHPDEFYIVPALFEDRLDTGDLVLDGEEDVYVVVTPRCNMANEPIPKHLILALCKPMSTEWEKLRDGFKAESKDKQKRAGDRLHDFAVQNHSTSTHFIPACGNKGPWLVDFREIKGVPSSAASNLLETRFASIATHFVPNLVQRYAAYLGRIGQPDLDWNVLREQVLKA